MKQRPEHTATLAAKFQELYELISYLRSPDGCPWDREQTAHSLCPSLAEEVFECISAIKSSDDAAITEELGDVLLVVLMIAVIQKEGEKLDMYTIIDMLIEKLIRRHPHVFSREPDLNQTPLTPTEVKSNWDRIKTSIEGRAAADTAISVPKELPPLARALHIQKKASKVGFDWDTITEITDKVSEELDEVQAAIHEAGSPIFGQSEQTQHTSTGSKAATSEHRARALEDVEKEIGDLFFSVVNLSRGLDIDPTVALHSSNERFLHRFSTIARGMRSQGLPLKREHRAEMERLWQLAKESDQDEKAMPK